MHVARIRNAFIFDHFLGKEAAMIFDRALRLRAIGVAAAALLLVIGCSNANAPNDAHFAAGITSFLRQGGNGRICYSMSHVFPLDIFKGRPSYGYYNPTDQENIGLSATTLDHLHQFVLAGIVATSHVLTPTENTDGGTFLSPAVRYALTPLGQQLIFPGNSSQNAQICFAGLTVRKVVDFTIPGQEHGETVSTVRWKAGAVPDKKLKPLFQKGKLAFLQAYAASQLTATRSGMAVLTNHGWVYNPND